MKITALVDNHARPGLASEHGLSLWIETPDGAVLFDTGQGPALEANATALGIPLESARAIVLSHGHYDHAGGLPYALGRNLSASVYLHPDAFSTRFSIRDNTPKPISMPEPARDALRAAGSRVVHITGPSEILPAVHVTGPIPRATSFEDTGGPFYLDAEGARPDPILDDLALWLETPAGLVVILGCAHAGVVNTLAFVCEQAGQHRIHAVVGGMHLAAASLLRLEKTAEALEQREVRLIAPCHCTGDEAVRFLQRRLPGRVMDSAAGSTIVIGGD